MKHTGKIKKVFSRIVSGVIAAASAVTMAAGMSIPAFAGSGLYADGYFNQLDSYWATVKHGNLSQNSMQDAGCGIFSFCNAINALNNGKTVSVQQCKNIAQWGYNQGYYTPGNGGLSNAYSFYTKVQNTYGSSLNFKYDSCGTSLDNKLNTALQNGSTAIVLIQGHYMCLAGYSNYKYHVIESYVQQASWPNHKRYSAGITSEHSYVTASQLNSLSVRGYWIMKPNGTVPPPPSTFKTIKNYQSGKMLNVVSNSSACGANVTVYQQDGTTGQNFKLNAHGGTKYFGGNPYQKYTLEAQCSPNCRLNVYGSTSVSGNNVNLWTTSGNDTQDWILQPSPYGGAGYYIIRSANNTSCVLTEAGTGNGSNVQISTYQSGNKNQIWYLGTI